MQFLTPYQIFWANLPLALTVAEIRKQGPGKAIEAIQRLRAIEGELGQGAGYQNGSTAYLDNNDPYKALRDFVAHVYDGSPAPFWLESAEAAVPAKG